MAKISIIMPVYNAEKYIGQTLGCILNQTFSDFELIVVDDCGTDRSMEIVSEIKDERIRIVRNDENKGIAYSRNIGLDIACGEYIALMDDDDLTPLNRLEKQNDFLDANNEIDVLGGGYRIIDETGKQLRLYSAPLTNPLYIKAYMMFYNPMANGTSMIRRKLIDDHCLRYRDNCLGMEDYRFWIECSLCGNITNVPDILLSWRRTDTNETSRSLLVNHTMRQEKYAELQRYAIKKNGFVFSESDLYFINRMFPESLKGTVASKKDLIHLYDVLENVIQQATALNLCNWEEIKICCKKMFSLRQENSDIW